MFLALLTLLTSLVISSVAIYYSVSGLAAIFSAAAIPIIIMGASLEVGKLITALWLHRNWKDSPVVLRSYFMIATLILMLITSIGIFGFLSRAHIEQTTGIYTVSTQVEQLNLDIRLEQEKIDNNQKIVSQLDAAVNNLLQGSATQSQQTRANSAQQASNLATQATRLRQQQAAERTRLQNEISAASAKIAELNRQKLQLEQQVRMIEAEVGPIKYIAQFVYGSDAGNNKQVLEKSVTWLILIIIFVFDPLAVLLLIASQISFDHARQARREKKEQRLRSLEPKIEPVAPAIVPDPVPAKEEAVIPAPRKLKTKAKEKIEPAPIIQTDIVPAVIVSEPPTIEPPIEIPPPAKKKESYIMKKNDQQITVEKKQ